MAKQLAGNFAGGLVFALTFGLLFTAYGLAELSPADLPVPQGLILAGAIGGIVIIPLLVGLLAPSAWMGAVPPLAYLLAIVLAPVTFGGGWRDVTYDIGLWGFLLVRVLLFWMVMGLVFFLGRGIKLRFLSRR